MPLLMPALLSPLVGLNGDEDDEAPGDKGDEGPACRLPLSLRRIDDEDADADADADVHAEREVDGVPTTRAPGVTVLAEPAGLSDAWRSFCGAFSPRLCA